MCFSFFCAFPVSVSVCICTYMHICTLMYTYTLAHIFSRILGGFLSFFVLCPTFTSSPFTFIYLSLSLYIYVCVCVCVCVCMQIYIYIYKYIYIYMYTYVYIHISIFKGIHWIQCDNVFDPIHRCVFKVFSVSICLCVPMCECAICEFDYVDYIFWIAA